MIENNFRTSRLVSSDDDDDDGPPHPKSRRGAHASSDWRYRLDEMIREKKEQREEQQRAKESEIRQRKNAEKNTLGEHGMKKTYGKGFDMLKKMGYKGGGLGKEGTGIANPLLVKIRDRKKGLQNHGESLNKDAQDLPAHMKLSSFHDSRSAVDLLLGKRNSSEFDSSPAAEEKPRLGRWKKNQNADVAEVSHRTADEIASETRLKHLGLLSNGNNLSYNDLSSANVLREEVEIFDASSSSGSDDGNSWSELNQPSITRRQLRREQARLRIFLHSPAPNQPLRIVDRTGPSERVIEDIDELRLKLTEASERADFSFRPEAIRQASNYEFHPSGEIKTVPPPRPPSRHDSIIPLAKRTDAPLSELRYNLQLCVSQIEGEVAQNTRNKVFFESKFQRLLDQEKTLSDQKRSTQKRSAALSDVLASLTRWRQSSQVEKLKDALESNPRQAAVKKYSSAEEDCAMQLSDDEGKQGGTVNPSDLLVELTAAFKHILRAHPADYYALELPSLACMGVDAILAYHGSSLHPFHLVPLLMDFRDECLPASQQTVELLREGCHTRIETYIIGALRSTFRGIEVDPSAQDLSALQAGLRWPISTDIMAQLLHDELFPKWLAVLKLWLSSPSLDLEEVNRWYNGWKSVFPPPLCYHPLLESQFMRGLQLISRHLTELAMVASIHTDAAAEEQQIADSGAATYEPPSSPPEEPSSPFEAPSTPEEPMAEPPVEPAVSRLSDGPKDDSVLKWLLNIQSVRSASSSSKSAVRLLEVLQTVAEENNVVMIPKRGRTNNGKQIYALGRSSIYVDAGVIYALKEYEGMKTWEVVSLADLLKRVGIIG